MNPAKVLVRFFTDFYFLLFMSWQDTKEKKISGLPFIENKPYLDCSLS